VGSRGSNHYTWGICYIFAKVNPNSTILTPKDPCVLWSPRLQTPKKIPILWNRLLNLFLAIFYESNHMILYTPIRRRRSIPNLRGRGHSNRGSILTWAFLSKFEMVCVWTVKRTLFWAHLRINSGNFSLIWAAKKEGWKNYEMQSFSRDVDVLISGISPAFLISIEFTIRIFHTFLGGL
jgi:hypothetical protein